MPSASTFPSGATGDRSSACRPRTSRSSTTACPAFTDVSYEKLPIDVTVVLDVSASVTGSVLDDLRRALRQLRADLGKQDRLRLLTFNMRVRRLVDFGDPAAAADTAIASLTASGSSAVFDSLAVALSSSVPPGRRQLIVLFSDGQDSSSITDADVLLDVARRGAPTVAVVLSSPSRQRPASLVRTSTKLSSATVGDLADQIAADTGGFVAAIAPGRERHVDLPPRARTVPHQLRPLLHSQRRSTARALTRWTSA